jgi:hypothetical protein
MEKRPNAALHRPGAPQAVQHKTTGGLKNNRKKQAFKTEKKKKKTA